MTRHLTVVPGDAPMGEPLSDLELLAAGQPVAVADCDLIAFANRAWDGLDPSRDADQYTLAEVMLDWYHQHVGTARRTKGDRALDLAVTLRRYLLPYAVETGYLTGKPHVGAFRVQHAEKLARILAGEQPLPAATVAGDLLGRYGAACVWLALDDAAQVCTGGAAAVTAAVRDGRLPVHHSGGQPLVAAADLRRAILLRERVVPKDKEATDRGEPHGLDRATAGNQLRVLRECLTRATDLGATITGTFTRVGAIEPLPHNRQRAESAPLNGAVSIVNVAAVCAYLSPVMQVALWLLRLTGMRIGEAYGLRLADYQVDDTGRGWLRIHTQGGSESLVRDSTDGRLRAASTKDHTKTQQSVRTIPIPTLLRSLLDELVRTHHAHPGTDDVDPDARLIPGLRSENDGGIAALRTALTKAIAAVAARGIAEPVFSPHDLRASWITDMYGDGTDVEERLHEWYTGHAVAKTVHQDYDLGPYPQELLTVVEAVDHLVERSGITDLRRPTAIRAAFGRDTRRGTEAERLCAALVASGWLLARGVRPPLPDATALDDQLLDSAGVAAHAGVSPGTARRWLRSGLIASESAAWGERKVLQARKSDVDVFLAGRNEGTTLSELAAETGWTYHQLFQLLGSLDIVANGRRGGAVRLTAAQADALRAEVDRRVSAAQRAVPIAEAAARLDLTVLTVETLLRRGELQPGPTPDGTRHRYITVLSIDDYLQRHPSNHERGDDSERLVPEGIAREALRLTRPQMRFLVASRQLVARTPGRRMYITLASIERFVTSRRDLMDVIEHCRAKSRRA